MNGTTIDRGAMTLLALHGIQGTRAAWRPIVEAIGEQARFITPDLRGRGEAFRGTCPEDYRLRAFADEAAGVARAQLGATPFVLAGWSMGVSVALEYLRLADAPLPEALILLSGTPAPGLSNWFQGCGQALLEEIAERERRLGLRAAADHQAVAWTWEKIRSVDHRAGLSAIALPTLIIHGSADADSPIEHAQWLADGLPNAELEVIDGAGHSLLSENTEAVVARMRAFLADLESTVHNNKKESP